MRLIVKKGVLKIAFNLLFFTLSTNYLQLIIMTDYDIISLQDEMNKLDRIFMDFKNFCFSG